MKRRRSRSSVSYRTLVMALAGLSVAWGALPDRPSVQAEEPYRQFLEKLNENGFHNLALVYLNDLEKGGQADATFSKEIPLSALSFTSGRFEAAAAQSWSHQEARRCGKGTAKLSER